MTDSEGTRVAEVTVRWVVCRKHADLFFRRNILTSRLPFGIRLRTFFAGKQPASTVTSRHSVCLASASPALAPAAWPVRNPARHVRGAGSVPSRASTSRRCGTDRARVPRTGSAESRSHVHSFVRAPAERLRWFDGCTWSPATDGPGARLGEVGRCGNGRRLWDVRH